MNRVVLFSALRGPLFNGRMSETQVSGVEAILDEWQRRRLTDLRWLAYILATAFHETGRAMQPVIETRQLSETQNPSVDTAIARLERAWRDGKMPWVKRAYWRKDKSGLSWLGRGLPQVTHLENYAWAEEATGIPFTKNPDLMLAMENAIPVMFIGMIEGKFTGKKLGDYFDVDTEDWFNARRIINATESAEKVAGYAKQFHSALLTAHAAATEVRIPPPPDIEPMPPKAPDIVLPSPGARGNLPPTPTFWAAVKQLFSTKG